MSCITRCKKIHHLKRIFAVPVNGTENANQASTYWEENVTVQKAIRQLSNITQIMRVLMTLIQGIVQTDPWYMRSKSTAIAKTHQCLEDGVQSYNIIFWIYWTANTGGGAYFEFIKIDYILSPGTWWLWISSWYRQCFLTTDVRFNIICELPREFIEILQNYSDFLQHNDLGKYYLISFLSYSDKKMIPYGEVFNLEETKDVFFFKVLQIYTDDLTRRELLIDSVNNEWLFYSYFLEKFSKKLLWFQVHQNNFGYMFAMTLNHWSLNFCN